MPRLTYADWSAFRRRDEKRKSDQREAIRQAVAISEVPLSPHLTQAILDLENRDARVVLQAHPGFPLAERRDSYLTSLAIAEQGIQDLLVAICVFENAAVAEDSNLFNRHGDAELNRFERQIQKELFAATNAVASLVDHARSVGKCHKLPEYETKRLECFGNDGLHEFVIALRVMLHHLHVVEAGWSVTRDLSEGTKTATFKIRKEVMKRMIASKRFRKANAAMLAYVEAAPENIDLRAIFHDYRARMAKFHGWMKEELVSETLTALRDYDRLIQAKINADQVIFWKAMLGNWLNWKLPPDPHKHLPRILSKEELEEICKLPRNSRAQVDLIIQYVDVNGAIDDALREQVYALFERSSA